MAEITIIPAKDRSDEIVRTAAYARVSSDSEDQLNSFAAQIRYYTELLKDSTDAVFVDMYADAGISGTSAAKRTEFQRLMSDCRKGKIDRILTKSISRFARNTKDSLEAVRELKTLGISVYFEKENIDTGEISSEMMLAIYSQFAQEESMSISRNCRLGVKKRMMDGTYKTASTPFGYDYVEGKLQINHEKAAIVKQIFDWYVGGIGMDEIASRLNSAGVRKEVWRHGTIRCILTNERYIGDKLLQKRYTTDTLPFKTAVNRGEKEQYYISGTHEPIIEKSIFDTAQKIFSAREKPSGHAIGNSAFRGKIQCGNCGNTFRLKTRKDCVRWVCRNHDESAANCSIRQIRETEFQALLEINVSVSSTNSAIIVIEIILFGSFDFRKSRHLNSCRFSIKTQCFWHIVSFLCSKMCCINFKLRVRPIINLIKPFKLLDKVTKKNGKKHKHLAVKNEYLIANHSSLCTVS